MEELLEKILGDPRAVIALSALAISFISLVLAIVTSFQNRKNNRLSVRPLAYIFPPDYEDRVAVIIQNKGVGPLITTSIKFVGENGVEKSYLVDFMPPLRDGYFWSTFSKTSKIVLRPSEEKVLLEFVGKIDDPYFISQRDKIREALGEVEIRIKYTSIFNESKPFKLNYKLTWFRREK